jgi:hypothetical protein
MSVQVFTGRVRGGTIVLDEGIELTEGARVTVIAGETDAPFELSAADEAELAESMAEADRGDVITGDELLRRLSR